MSDSLLDVFLFCPVPDLQKPIAEYFNLMSPGFKPSFFSAKIWPDKISLFIIRCYFLIIIISIFFSSIYYFQSNFFFYLFPVSFYWAFSFLRKNQLLNKLLKPLVIYEINWYEASSWEKPLDIIKTDNLLALKCKENWFDLFLL